MVPNIVRERESFTLEDVRRVVKESIKRYDEDRIGEPDHALESAGKLLRAALYDTAKPVNTLVILPSQVQLWLARAAPRITNGVTLATVSSEYLYGLGPQRHA